MSPWLRSTALSVFRQLPLWARELLWLRTPAERVREYQARRSASTVAAELRRRLTAGPGPGILILPTDTWFSSLFQRPQQMARALADAGSPVVFCEPWTRYHTRTGNAKAERRFSGVKDIGERLHLLRWPPSALRNLIGEVEPEAVLMIFPAIPFQDVYLPSDSKSLVVYEVLDNHELMDSGDVEWMQRHDKWVDKADVLVASADDLLAQLKSRRPDTLLLPNAVRLEDWQDIESHEIPADIADACRAERVITYYGSLAEWFDWPLWIHAAKARPNWSFVLIGLPYDGNRAAVEARVANAPNMYYLGPKPYRDLPGYLQQVDVATIPFVLNSITHACSPVKLFEYMAAGKPIVTTAMREVLKYKSVLIGHSPEDFVRRLDEAVAKRSDPAYLALLRTESEQNTWHARAAAILEALSAQRRTGGKPRRDTLGHRF